MLLRESAGRICPPCNITTKRVSFFDKINCITMNSTTEEGTTKERYVVVDEPDGGVAVAFNEEVKPPPPLPDTVEIEQEQQQQSFLTEILRISRRVARQRAVSHRLSDQAVARSKLLSNFFAAVLLFSAVANLALHRRFFDILNVIFMSFTIAAIRYDSLVSRMFITMHAVLSIMGMAYFAVRLYWGQVGYLLGCIILCTFVLTWRDEAVISLL